MANQAIQTHLANVPRTCIPIFTDGSALKNPGPSGAAAVVYTHGLSHQPVILKKPVSEHSTSYHGELYAVSLALDYIISMALSNQLSAVETIIMYTDCMAAMQTVINSVKTNYTTLMHNIEEAIVINLYIACFHQMRNSRDCRAVVTDRKLIFGMKIALGQATNEKSPKWENVAMVTRKYGNADFWAPFGPQGI